MNDACWIANGDPVYDVSFLAFFFRGDGDCEFTLDDSTSDTPLSITELSFAILLVRTLSVLVKSESLSEFNSRLRLTVRLLGCGCDISLAEMIEYCSRNLNCFAL